MALHPQLAGKTAKYLHLYLAPAPGRGLGLFTATSRAAGEIVIEDQDGDFYDRVLSYAEVVREGWDLHADVIQVADDGFVVATGTIDDFMNHSCDPNCGVRLTDAGYLVVAIDDIAAGAELTYDYSTLMTDGYQKLKCLCGAPACRGLIGGFESLSEDLQRRYAAFDVVAPFARAAARTVRAETQMHALTRRGVHGSGVERRLR